MASQMTPTSSWRWRSSLSPKMEVSWLCSGFWCPFVCFRTSYSIDCHLNEGCHRLPFSVNSFCRGAFGGWVSKRGPVHEVNISQNSGNLTLRTSYVMLVSSQALQRGSHERRWRDDRNSSGKVRNLRKHTSFVVFCVSKSSPAHAFNYRTL